MIVPGETEAGSAGMQPCRGIAWRARQDDEQQRGNPFPALLPSIGLIDPDALKIHAPNGRILSLTESARSPFSAEPEHLQDRCECRHVECRHTPGRDNSWQG